MRTFHRFPTPASIVWLAEVDLVEQAWGLVGNRHGKIQWLTDLYGLFTSCMQWINQPVPLVPKKREMGRLDPIVLALTAPDAAKVRRLLKR